MIRTRLEDLNGDFIVPEFDHDSLNYFRTTDPDNIEIGLKHVATDARRLCVQAGGNLGFFPREYGKVFNRVLTFEPDPANFYCLVHNAPAEHIVKLQACLGNVSTWLDIEVPDVRHVGMNRVAHNGDPKYPTISIDSLALPACDFIQLDLEGYEWAALQGAVKTIEKFRPVLQVECANHTSRYGSKDENVIEMLTSLGYSQVDEIWLDKIFVAG